MNDLMSTIKNLDKVMEIAATSLEYDGEDVVLEKVYDEPENIDLVVEHRIELQEGFEKYSKQVETA